MKRRMTLNIPKQLQMLCELLETTPQEIIQAFINDLSLEVNSSGSDEREMAVNYFMRCSYGMHRYSFDQVREMFDDLDSLRWQQYERKGKEGIARQNQYLEAWFREWKTQPKE